jgi:hypothetical protein
MKCSKKSIDKSGYILIHKPNHPKVRKNNYILEHRVIFEEYYNCCLLPWTDVHHKDGNKQNNDINNLEPIFHNKHVIIEKTKDMSNRMCLICNSSKTRIEKPTNNPHWYKLRNGFMCYNCNQRLKWRR